MQLKHSSLRFSKVLIIERLQKTENDRTWCFWSKEANSWYDAITFRKWNKFRFKSKDFTEEYELAPFQYKMIRGIDFYSYCLKQLKDDPRFEFKLDTIIDLESEGASAKLITASTEYIGEYVFNSAIIHHDKKSHHVNYVQHFKGWIIDVEQDVFDETSPIFMDFSVEQHEDCRFVYVIPHSKRRALIEYTGFSPDALKEEDYDLELTNYIHNHLKISDFKITEVEKGVIPMAESDFVNPFGKRVINIGTAGGYSKPSTGFTFYFIQRNAQAIVAKLEQSNSELSQNARKKRFLFYDKVLLDVMNKKDVSSSELFTSLFKRNSIRSLLSFLNEESTFTEELKIMNSVKDKNFIFSAMKKLLYK